MINSILHWLWESPSADDVVPQFILPRQMRKEVSAQLHNTPTVGNLGVNKTSERTTQRFYWPHCLQHVKDCKDISQLNSADEEGNTVLLFQLDGTYLPTFRPDALKDGTSYETR